MGVVIKNIGNPRKQHNFEDPDRYLQLQEYLILSERMISKFAPKCFRGRMLNDEDAISHVAYEMMWADSLYDASRDTKQTAWRGCEAKRAIYEYIRKWYKVNSGDAVTVSLEDCKEIDIAVSTDYDDYAEQMGLLRKLIDTLPAIQRQCVMFYFFDHLTFPQISNHTHMTPQGVRRHIMKAIKVLRKKVCLIS